MRSSVTILRMAVLLATSIVFAEPVAGFQESGTLRSDRIGLDDRITIGEIVTFHSEIYGGDRQVLLFLPADYANSTMRYPVVYLLDGNFFFLPTSGIVDFYSTIDKMPKMIVAAIVSSDRVHEFSMAPSGGAAEFSAFLKDELIPHIDGHFRTAPFNVLIGHSLGGVFAIHSLMTNPGLFDAHIAASPALHWNGRSEVARAREVLGSGAPLKNFLYMTYSGGDGENIQAPTDIIVDLLGESPPPGLRWQFTYLPDDKHNSSPMRSVLGGLTSLFSGWAYSGENDAEELREHYRSLSEEFGFECKPSVGAVASRGGTLVRRGNLQEAIRVFQYNADLHPEIPDVHERLGGAYLAMGDTAMASKAFEKSLELRPGNATVLKVLRDLGKGGMPR